MKILPFIRTSLTLAAAIAIVSSPAAAEKHQKRSHGQAKAAPAAGAKPESSKKVKAVVQPSALDQVQAPKEKKKDAFDDDFGKLPTYIKADSLTFKNKERNFVYSGNVEVTHGDMILTSNLLEGNYDESNQIKDLTARQNVTIIKGEDMRASGEQAIYDKTTDTMVLSDNPELQQNGSVLTADRIRIYMKENRSVAEGQVRVKLIKGEDSEDKDKPGGLKALKK